MVCGGLEDTCEDILYDEEGYDLVDRDDNSCLDYEDKMDCTEENNYDGFVPARHCCICGGGKRPDVPMEYKPARLSRGTTNKNICDTGKGWKLITSTQYCEKARKEYEKDYGDDVKGLFVMPARGYRNSRYLGGCNLNVNKQRVIFNNGGDKFSYTRKHGYAGDDNFQEAICHRRKKDEEKSEFALAGFGNQSEHSFLYYTGALASVSLAFGVGYFLAKKV